MREPNDELVSGWGSGDSFPVQNTQATSATTPVNAVSVGHDNPFAYLTKPLPDLICFSHLRWDFVFQRPQHLMTRFTKYLRVFFVEEPDWDAQAGAEYLEVQNPKPNLWRVVPHLSDGLKRAEQEACLAQLLQPFMLQQQITQFISWYYTPMAVGFTEQLPLRPIVTVYDCMDELSAFRGAPPLLLDREKQLFGLADLVFTGGQSLYEAKRERHPHVSAFPSSIDRAHFEQARQALPEPADQANIPHPRMGFYGVLDERFDIELLRELAALRPEWHFVMLGPVVKIHPDDLPKAANIHYLGMKSYDELPQYLSGWDIALLLFALNESTRFISPTKTPEYLAAGKPTVSTPIRDVVRPYGELNLVHIASSATEFEAAVSKALAQVQDANWLDTVDTFLQQISWDKTWEQMASLIVKEISPKY